MDDKLSNTEQLDFHYLLTLMPALESEHDFAWLPELFSIVGHENLIKLCKYAGGEVIEIPTLEQLSEAVTCLQLYYDVYVKHNKTISDVPAKRRDMVSRIESIVNAG